MLLTEEGAVDQQVLLDAVNKVDFDVVSAALFLITYHLELFVSGLCK